jgi:hypothetical protein
MIKTKYGNAKPNETGHFRITSRKEGNNGKYLHRLIWEEHYGEIPEGFVIHHKNGNPQDNRIENMEMMPHSNHVSLHNCGESHPFYGKHLSAEHRRKVSENHADTSGENNGMYGKRHKLSSRLQLSQPNSTTGIYRVQKKKSSSCAQGFIWEYRYYDEKGVRRSIMSVDLEKLKSKVLKKGLEWIEFKGGEDIEICNQ